jgi:8-oxo-dGTP diphosphatase
MLRVVAAVIERDGLILIGQRPRGKSHALEWEFPGGKVEPGESPRKALQRELREELEIEARIGRERSRYRFTYGSRNPIELIFYTVTRFTGEPVNRAFAEIRWVSRWELGGYSFLEGDLAFIRLLEKEAGGNGNSR